MKKICFVTGTRADYGILKGVMQHIKSSDEAVLQIIATNMHLSDEFGHTVDEIEKDGFTVDVKINSLVKGGDAVSTVKSMAKVEDGMAEALNFLKPDLVVILGDRYEALAAAASAAVFNIPVAHLHGGEVTEGAFDDLFRNAITQLSSLHFAATPLYAERIVSMKADRDKVFHSGAPGADVKEEDFIGADNEFMEKTGIHPMEPFLILAMHPVTKAADLGISELKSTLEALEKFVSQGYKVLITMPNSDPGTITFSETLLDWAKKFKGSVVTVKSLGSRLFHYAMDHALAMIGNSSAALIEAPTHRLGAVNVGQRQKGRAHGITVIDVPGDKEAIVKALESTLSMEMKAVLMGMSVSSLNPYFKEDSSKFIADGLLRFVLQ